MTTPNSLPHDPAAILASVEAFFAEMPPKRRRTAAELSTAPEWENYGDTDEPAPDSEPVLEAEVQFHLLVRQLGEAQNEVIARAITKKLYYIVGFTQSGPAFEEAMRRAIRRGGK